MTVAPDIIKTISAISKISPRKGKVTNRKTYGFNIRLSGCMHYDFDGKEFTVNKGEMIFVPKGASYTYDVKSTEDSKSTIISMEADFDKFSLPRVYPLTDAHFADFIMNHFSNSWNLGTTADKYKCISYLYDLLAYIDNYDNLKYMEKNKFNIIDPALSYLKSHIYDPALKTDKLAEICGISNVYFRKIFISRFGRSPKNYIIEKRLSRAKTIIDSGEFDTVKKLAMSVGYDDPLYFGKVFKRQFGISPCDMNII